MTNNKTFPLNHSLACASYAIYLAFHTCICEAGRKNRKSIDLRVANKQRKQDPKSRVKNKSPLSLYLIVMFMMLYYSLLL